MKRPTRIAAVVATTGLLMAATTMGVVAIQRSSASPVASAIVAQGPGATSAADAVAILGDPASGPALPPIPTVPAPAQAPEVPPATSVAVQAPDEETAGEHDSDDEREDHDD